MVYWKQSFLFDWEFSIESDEDELMEGIWTGFSLYHWISCSRACQWIQYIHFHLINFNYYINSLLIIKFLQKHQIQMF